MSLDLDNLLQPVSDERPAGEDLELDPSMQELEQAARSVPERRVGTSVIPAEPPDWGEVLDQACALLARTKDLSVTTKITQSCTAMRGLAGLAEGLALIEGVLERFWDHCYPELDPDDPAPAMVRVNRLQDLAGADTVRVVRAVPVASSRDHRVSVRELLIATGREREPDGYDGPGSADVATAFRGLPAERQQAFVSDARACRDTLQRIVQVFFAHAKSPGDYLDLGALSTTLDSLVSIGEELVPEIAAAAEAPGEGPTEGAAGGPAPGVAQAPERYESREQIAKTLLKMCDYFTVHEPSSPVPIVLRGAQRMLGMSFLELSASSDIFQRISEVLASGEEQ